MLSILGNRRSSDDGKYENKHPPWDVRPPYLFLLAGIAYCQKLNKESGKFRGVIMGFAGTVGRLLTDCKISFFLPNFS